MEEVDNIIIHTLKEIGCELPDDLVTLREFSVEMVVNAVANCLAAINEQISVPAVLPPSMSARFRIGSTLATACKELGYKGDIGYQTFLYANEHDLRNVMMFLIEKLPKENTEGIDEPIGTSILLSRRIAAELKRQLSTQWTPAYCKKKNVASVENNWFFQGTSSFHKINTCLLQYPTGVSDSNKIQAEEYEKMNFVTSQPKDRRDIYASLVEENTYNVAEDQEWENEWNRLGIASRLSVEEYKRRKRERLLKKIKEKLFISPQSQSQTKASSGAGALKELLDSMAGSESKKTGKGSRFTHAEKLQFAQDVEKVEAKITDDQHQREKSEEETEEEVQQKREVEIESLRAELNELSLRSQNCQVEIKQMVTQQEKVESESSSIESETKELEARYKVKKKTYDLLPEADYNINKLMQLVESSKLKLVNLNYQWEVHRVPLVENYEQLKEQSESKMSQVESYAEQVRSLREKMKSAADETKVKEELLKQLTTEYESMTKDLNRSAYTKRILEIVGNIKKQKEQIARVLIDTKALQKDINFLTGKLDRTFIVTDELIFRDAKRDEFSKKAYKLLASLHESFGSLVGRIENTGTIMREIRDLEEQIDNVSEKEVNDNLTRISEDLKQMRDENQEVIAKIKSKR